MKNTNRGIGLVVLAIGITWTLFALQLPLINKGVIGPGLWPLIIGLSLIGLGIVQIFMTNSKVKIPPDWPRGGRLFRILVILGSFVVYLLIVEKLGFAISSALFFFVIIRFWGGYSWFKVSILSILIAISLHVVFSIWLSMPLPTGLF